jgi:hypothetical protein
MNKPGPAKSARPSPRPSSAGAVTSTRRLDRGMLWSLMIFLLSFPMMLVSLAIIAYVAELRGIPLGTAEELAAQQTLNTVYIVMALAPLALAAVIGFLAWRRRRQAIGLAVAVLSVLAGIGFVLLPRIAAMSA